MYGSNGSSGSGEEGSLIGTFSFSRIVRVVSQRWLSVFVFVLIGLIVAFAVYRISPTVYEASSEISLDLRRSSGSSGSALDQATPDYGSNYEEIFNTRKPDWRSEKIVGMILKQYRADNPSSVATDEELIEILSSSELEIVRRSRLIRIVVRASSPRLCSAVANAYAKAIDKFTEEENKIRCDKAVSQIHINVTKQRKAADEAAKKLYDFRTANKVDTLRSTRDTLQQTLQKATGDILALSTEKTQLVEWEKMLAQVKQDPTTYGSLAVNVPRAQEIATEFKSYQDAEGDYQKLLFAYTENHPEVVEKKKAADLSKQRFIDAAARALLTGRSTLQVVSNQLAVLEVRQKDLRDELSSVADRIVLAESGLESLERDAEAQNQVLTDLLLEENKARIAAQSNNEIVRVGRRATEPQKPVLPDPLLIFGAGAFLSVSLGLLFVLVMDNLEDTVINLSDIEGRLALRVLAVLPHVARKKREEVAKFLVEDRYSQFSESVAGLKNLLDSPRYEPLSKCMLVISTQPGEGKTITSTSLAIAYAQSGRRTLHVDFDMRRPRLARVWGVDIDESRSLSHTLQNSDGDMTDFSSLVNETGVKNLDAIVSAAPDGVNPSMIFGSAAVSKFFEWARKNYERIIVDSPPYGLVGDVVSLAIMVDSVLVMCCPDRTRFKPIQHCSRCLTEMGANIIGVVVNDVEIASASAFSPIEKGCRRYGYGRYGYHPKAARDEEDAELSGESKDFSDEE
jgi:capsular exopolysaccharide synthesis family protein